MTLPKNETGIPDSIVGTGRTGSTVTHIRYSVFRIFLLTSFLVGLPVPGRGGGASLVVWLSTAKAQGAQGFKGCGLSLCGPLSDKGKNNRTQRSLRLSGGGLQSECLGINATCRHKSRNAHISSSFFIRGKQTAGLSVHRLVLFDGI